MREELKKALEILKNYRGEKIRIMEVCGTHTHEIFKLGIRRILSPDIELISGPGCPVCVTDTSYIDKAIYLLEEKNVIIGSFGDLIRVPGNEKSLARARAEGREVELMYSPLDALEYAKDHPDREIVFLSVGFETTVPSHCLAVKYAIDRNIKNFSILNSCKTMPKVYEKMKGSADIFLYPGHVNAITGTKICEDMRKLGVSGIVTGFTAAELITSLATAVTLYTREKSAFYKNCYTRVVKDEGSKEAIDLINEMMEPCDSIWRGLGLIEGSGLKLRDKYSEYDASKKFNISKTFKNKNTGCRCGDVLKGNIKPYECPLFGKACTPEDPVGACMVSSEGACSAWYLYGAMDILKEDKNE